MNWRNLSVYCLLLACYLTTGVPMGKRIKSLGLGLSKTVQLRRNVLLQVSSATFYSYSKILVKNQNLEFDDPRPSFLRGSLSLPVDDEVTVNDLYVCIFIIYHLDISNDDIFSGNKAIASIRKSKEISRLIYISSNHKPPVKNLLDFANVDANSPFEGLDPFVVKRVLPLDTSPHTLRCELVFMCERLATSDIPKPNRLTLTSSKKISVKKISSQLKKHYYDSNANQGGRSNYFPTEEMVRRYSNTRKPQQEIDYQKRDSLYPPPLRGALYQGHEEDRPYYPPAKDVYPERYSTRHESNYSSRAVPVSDNRDLARYNSFRRDMEDALNETSYYTPGKQLTSRKLAYANALLEEGIRIASEVLDDGYTRRPSSSGYYSRQRNPRTGNKYRY
ncbi:hypothetical protein J6590_062396 [Homalodisca vitripennis]|nr:hypothetical protein J6590_062396 [Homalodisca vitripennis]